MSHEGDLAARLRRAVRSLRLLEAVWPEHTDGLSDVTAAADVGLERLGRFRIVRPLGRGGHGVVYQARDPLLGRDVALKIPRLAGLLCPELRGRFLREARLAAGLSHPNLVPLFEAGAVGPACYLASAYCPGPNLAAWQRQWARPVDPRAAARLIATLADAVGFMHERGILHRDLKPANILLEPPAAPDRAGGDAELGLADFTPKLTDFGLAKELSAGPEETPAGAVLGTPFYMAPEQAEGRVGDIGPHTDLYGLGAVLYELLTGRPPFQGRSDLDTLLKVLAQEPAPPRRLRPGVPRDLEAVCLCCLERDPRRRYGSAAALADDLRRFLAGEPVLARPAGVARRLAKWYARRPLVAGLLTTLAVVFLAGFAAVLWQWQRAEHQYHRAEANLRQAHQAVEDHFRVINDNHLFEDAGLAPARAELLQVSLKYYRAFLEQGGHDQTLEPRLAEASFRAAFITAMIGDERAALAMYQESLPRWEKLARQNPGHAEYAYFLAKTHHLIGRLHMNQEVWPAADESLQQARSILQAPALALSGNASLKRELAHVQDSTGELHRLRGRHADALDSFRAGQALWVRLAAQEPDSKEIRARLARSHLQVGKQQMHLGKAEEAEPCLETARAILESFTSPDGPGSGVHDLASTYHSLATLHYKRKQFDGAIEMQQKGRQLGELLVQRYPAVTAYRRDLGGYYILLGTLHQANGDNGAAVEVIRLAIATCAKLVRDHPTGLTYRRNLARAQLRAANILLADGKVDEAQGHLDRSWDLYAELGEGQTASRNTCALLARAFQERGRECELAGRSAEARNYFERARLLALKSGRPLSGLP